MACGAKRNADQAALVGSPGADCYVGQAGALARAPTGRDQGGRGDHLCGERGGGVVLAVSVVMPVYNAGQYLHPALLSLELQDLPREQFELVAVNDGSTDGSGELLDRWGAQRPHVTVLHQANSGWPGQPRNRGVVASRGEYVFFMDADDYLGAQALRRMVQLARRWNSDVLSPKIVGVGGRGITHRVGTQTTPEADLLTVFDNLYPHKLFRRTFLLEHGLRFPEGRVRLEDAIFVSRALLLARRVATAGDYDYYCLRRRRDGGNISRSSLGGARYVESVRTICRTVRELCQDADLADSLVVSVYGRDALKVFRPDRFLRYSPKKRRACTRAVRALADELVPVALEERLPEPLRTRSRLARAGDVTGQLALARAHLDRGLDTSVPAWRRLAARAARAGWRAS